MGGDRWLSGHSYYDGGIRISRGNYTLYVDESRIQGGPGIFTVAGLLMHQDGLKAARVGCRAVMEEHGGMEGGRMCEIKFSHMMGPGKGFPGADGCRRGPASGILGVIGREYMPFFCMMVDKQEFRDAKMPGYDGADHYATERVIIAALDLAGRRDRRVRVIRDRGNDKRDIDIEESLNEGIDGSGDRIRNIASYAGYDAEESEGEFGLQLADFCAGAVARVMSQDRAVRDRAGCYCMIRQLQDTPGNRRGIPAFYPPDGSARSRFVRMGHTCPCVSGWHAFLGAAGGP